MSFPPKVKESALVACGRCCCICHRFCGLKMECHHIIQEHEEGQDVFDNCIPLCLDCHADMRSYDAKHPKGTKYTPAELRMHRDRWYDKVSAGGGAASLEAHAAVDKEVFSTFQKQIPYYPFLDYLKGRDFGNLFELAALDPIFRYAHYSDRPEYEFVDPELEAARGEFARAASQFTGLISRYTVPTHVPGYSGVPREWASKQTERFDEVITDINEAADAIERTYGQIIRLVRRRLGVAGVIEPDPSSE